LGSKARDWHAKPPTARRLLGFLNLGGLLGRTQVGDAKESEANAPRSSSSDAAGRGDGGGLGGGGGGAWLGSDDPSASPSPPSAFFGRPPSRSQLPLPPKLEYAPLPWCGGAGHRPATAAAPSASGGGSGSRLGGCLARPLSWPAFLAPLPFVHHTGGGPSGGQPFPSGAGSGGGGASPSPGSGASSGQRLNAPHLVTAFRLLALEWAAIHAPPHAFFLWLDLTQRAAPAPLPSPRRASSDRGSRGGGGDGLLGSLLGANRATDNDAPAQPPPPPGKYSFLCLPSLLAELEARPHERFVWRRLPCGPSSRPATPSSCSGGGGGEEADAAANPPRDDSFLLVSRDVAELLRGVARTPLVGGGQLLLLDRLLKRLPLTALHDPRRLVGSSEVRGGRRQHPPPSSSLRCRTPRQPHPSTRIPQIYGLRRLKKIV
jgi:hypothetical protein